MPPAASNGFTGLRLADATCDKTSDNLCGWIHNATGQEWLGRAVTWMLATPLTIAAILLLAGLARFLLFRVIDRTVRRASEGEGGGLGSRTAALFESSPLAVERRAQRAKAVGSVLRSLTTGVVLGIAILMVMDVLGLPIGPLLASAGILGVALGFGAQTLVKDFISGIFMIIEDQFGVGDVIDMGEANGVVEGVGLRVTRLRDVNGVVWHVRNGEVLRVGNKSQGWSRAVLDIEVAYGSDLAEVRETLLDVANALYHDEQYAGVVLQPPEVWGVEALAADGIVMRLVVTTQPLQQWAVARDLRGRIKAEFDHRGIEIPYPQRTVWVRGDGPGSNQGGPAADQPEPSPLR